MPFYMNHNYEFNLFNAASCKVFKRPAICIQQALENGMQKDFTSKPTRPGEMEMIHHAVLPV